MLVNLDWTGRVLALQEVDRRLDRLQQEIESLPQELVVADEKEKELRDRHEIFVEACQILRKKINRKEQEIGALREKAAKYQTQSSMAKDNESFHLLLENIEKTKQQISDSEDEEFVILEELDQFEAKVASSKEELKADLAHVENLRTSLKDKASKAKAEITKLEKLKETKAADVDAETLERYTFLRAKKGRRDVVVPINGTQCGACHLKLTQQEVINAKSHVLLASCGNCSALIYA